MPFDNDSYLRAQRQYDAQEDPTYNAKTCPKCGGDGELEDDDGNSIVCPRCEGNGEV